MIRDVFCFDMTGRVILCLIQILFCWIHLHLAQLPLWAYRENSCPDPNNISQWIAASQNINCYHNLTSTNSSQQDNVYHCIPSAYLNETVEFCGKSKLVPLGFCPVFNYTFGSKDEPDFYSCETFMSGCPAQKFPSKDVRKFPACLRLNYESSCFTEERNCNKRSKFPKPTTKTTNNEKDLGWLEIILSIVVVIQFIIIGVLLRKDFKCKRSSNQPGLSAEVDHLLENSGGNGKQHLTFQITADYQDKKLRIWLADKIGVQPNQIKITCPKNEPVFLTYSMCSEHANTILHYLKTDDGREAASSEGVVGVPKIRNGIGK